ncbi:hypothetical protein EST38_g9483 [Candolleomyces aberdarensis]|uniref:Ricin B lectin domain-containing protein n=1 Tax=Candolleomyces aberdarensis TaxID=2316362 RepID=A0A4Q2D9T2_9AGAR|nr:hypothetical protein EST38_g9483 [Candolleomyces aberdarensis]
MLNKFSTYLSLLTSSLVLFGPSTASADPQWGNNNGWNPPPPPPPQWGKRIQLHPNWNWGKCLDVRGAVFANGTPVDIFDCNGTPAQNWIINPGSTKVQLADTNFCLDAGDWPSSGTQLKIWTCYNNLPAQQWWYTDDKRIALQGRGFCLDLTNGGTWNYNVMQIWNCTPNNQNQVWV